MANIDREHDSCAVYAALLKEPAARNPSAPLWRSALEALGQMEHRSGQLDGKSDGTGILTSIPWHVWSGAAKTHTTKLWVLSLAMPVTDDRRVETRVTRWATSHGFTFIDSRWEVIDHDQGLWTALLRRVSQWPMPSWTVLESLEREFPGQIANFSQRLAVLKMRVDARTLAERARKLWGPAFQPRVVVGHNRFSTNTATELRRVQPFLQLAHNGEINTIDRVRRELAGIGLNPVGEGSDSQTLDRALTQMAHRFQWGLAETMRLLSPPSPAVIQTWPETWQRDWASLENFWTPVVQGPQALVATNGYELVGAVDALGLRPLWVMETRDAIILTSEPGVVECSTWTAEPRMLGPGEVAAWRWTSRGPVVRIPDEEVVYSLISRLSSHPPHTLTWSGPAAHPSLLDRVLAADGWTRDDLAMINAWRSAGQEPIGSLGWDGPPAALNEGIVNLSDYLHETVAVVTNPALDREREGEHFRLTTWLGEKPDRPGATLPGPFLRLDQPWLDDQALATVMQHFGGQSAVLALRWPPGATELEAALRLANTARGLVQSGQSLVVLSDAGVYDAGELSLDPLFAVSAVRQALDRAGLGRKASVVVRSGMIRHLHDAVMLLGCGADALVPHALWAVAQVPTVVGVMNHGLEKILSTMGTHWLSGWGHNMSAVGLPEEIADMLSVPSWAGVSLDCWQRQRESVRQQRAEALTAGQKPHFVQHFNPHVYKACQQLVQGSLSGEEFHGYVRELERKMPVQLRHTLTVPHQPVHRPHPVSLAVGEHALPFVISSMSFGSQGEVAFRAYAEAARLLNMVAMNGEGGEIPDMVGRYRHWRGYQVASGRFGVNAGLLNGANYAEIKIGQGAKPGEGGHLPGKKVSVKVADARHARPGIDLISPSNNHDLYSIEDLRQLIDELKAVNPVLKVVVKVPVVPNIGIIAVGIVKAGADVVALSGFEGGTGAARLHALRHVGLSADIGVPLVHQALVASGLRDRVEVWADGGVRTGDDVLKLVLLGADRVGFGTMAMVALGCTICRQCQKDTCHVGITTQIDSVAEANQRGIRRFQPQTESTAVRNLVAYFEALGKALAEELSHLGLSSVRDAVGQWQFLQQWTAQERVDYLGWTETLKTAGELCLLSEANGEAISADTALASGHRWRGSDRRLMGIHQSGRNAGARERRDEQLVVHGVAGQGFGAFLSDGVTCVALGGAQDGVGKAASGGRIWIMKNEGRGGHVGKSLAYGAQGGVIVVQGSADSRAGVRMAGARLVILGDGLPLPASAQGWWESAAIKGFGFEYMTRGEALVLADPGPWLAAGMTGGTIYLRRDDRAGLTPTYLASRLSSAAQAVLKELQAEDTPVVEGLLEEASQALRYAGQLARARQLQGLFTDLTQRFVKIVPSREQLDQEIATE